MSPRWMSILGTFDNDRYCGHTTVQYDLDKYHGESRERPMFMHSNLLKLMSYEVTKGSAFSEVVSSREVHLMPTRSPTYMHSGA